MRRYCNFFIAILLIVVVLGACSSSPETPIQSEQTPTKPSEGDASPSSSEAQPSDQANTYFTTDTVTLGEVTYSPGDRLEKLIDAGWKIDADEKYTVEQTVEETELAYLDLELGHASYPGVALFVAVDLLENGPEEKITDGYISSFHLIFHLSEPRSGDVPWSIGGVLDNTLSLEEAVSKFDGYEAEEGTPDISMIVDLSDYCENSAFRHVEIEWDIDERFFKYVVARFDLDTVVFNL